MEASGHARWFERQLGELQFELSMGDASEIRRKRGRKQKTDRQLQAVALNEGLLCRKKLWRERGRQQLESFALAGWASRRRRDLLELLDRLNPTIAELSQAIEQEAEKCPEAQRWMTHPGVGAWTALALVLILGDADRFQCGKQVASYLGLVPLEDSSGNRRRLGHLTKQGSSMLRFPLVEAAQVTVRCLPEWRRQ
jgi:transposase